MSLLCLSLHQGSRTSGLQTSTSSQISDSMRLKIKRPGHATHLSHPETVPLPLSLEKPPSTKPLAPGSPTPVRGKAAFHKTACSRLPQRLGLLPSTAPGNSLQPLTWGKGGSWTGALHKGPCFLLFNPQDMLGLLSYCQKEGNWKSPQGKYSSLFE